MDADQPKQMLEQGALGSEPGRASHLQSLGMGLALGALGALPAAIPGCDVFSLLCWIALLGPATGAIFGAQGFDPLRFGAVAPALWAVALATLGAGEEQASLPSPALGALAWSGLYFLGVGIGAWWGSSRASATGLLLAAALLVGLPSRGGIDGQAWSPRAASALLDLSPFVFLAECSGVRDMAWHRSMYASVGTDRFQRSPWNAAWAATSILAVGIGSALLGHRRRRIRAQAR